MFNIKLLSKYHLIFLLDKHTSLYKIIKKESTGFYWKNTNGDRALCVRSPLVFWVYIASYTIEMALCLYKLYIYKINPSSRDSCLKIASVFALITQLLRLHFQYAEFFVKIGKLLF